MNEQQSILVVDDDSAVCKILYDFFTIQDYDCQTVCSGLEALVTFQESRPQVVLIELDMPGMNGLEVAAKILDTSPETAVVLMFGSPNVESAIQAMRLGVADILLKPFDSKTVLESVRKAISPKEPLLKLEKKIARLKYRLQELPKVVAAFLAISTDDWHLDSRQSVKESVQTARRDLRESMASKTAGRIPRKPIRSTSNIGRIPFPPLAEKGRML